MFADAGACTGTPNELGFTDESKLQFRINLIPERTSTSDDVPSLLETVIEPGTPDVFVTDVTAGSFNDNSPALVTFNPEPTETPPIVVVVAGTIDTAPFPSIVKPSPGLTSNTPLASTSSPSPTMTPPIVVVVAGTTSMAPFASNCNPSLILTDISSFASMSIPFPAMYVVPPPPPPPGIVITFSESLKMNVN